MPQPIYTQIGRAIRARRRVLDKAQELLARDVGMSRATLANIETGRQRIQIHQVYAFAKALDLKVGDLLPEQLPKEASSEWSGAPIEGDLNAEQKNQVLGLITQVQPQQSKRTEANDGQPTARVTGATRTKAAR